MKKDKRIIKSGYHILDARKGVKQLAANSINVTITSPPYWNLKDYGGEKQIGFGQGYEEYLNDLKEIFGFVYRATKKNGSLWITIDTFKQRGEMRVLPFDIANQLKTVGWKLQDIIIWVKDKTLPWSHKGKMRNIFEYILFFSKGSKFKYYIDRLKEPMDLQKWWVKYPERYGFKGKVPERLWDFPIPVQGSWSNAGVRHFCPFPSDLIERILLLTTDKGDAVLDPFAGSGTVLAQSIAMKRNAIGFDLNPAYRKLYKKHVLPHIFSEKTRRDNALKNLQKRQIVFAKKIHSLRALKYPIELLKKINGADILDLSDVEAIFLIKEQTHNKVRVIYMLSKGKGIRSVRKNINKFTSIPPLSKYGLSPSIEFVSKAKFTELFNDEFKKASFFVYLNGKTNFYEKRVVLRDLCMMTKLTCKNGFPLLFSNLGERVK